MRTRNGAGSTGDILDLHNHCGYSAAYPWAGCGKKIIIASL